MEWWSTVNRKKEEVEGGGDGNETMNLNRIVQGERKREGDGVMKVIQLKLLYS